jgi:hypothetical protein
LELIVSDCLHCDINDLVRERVEGKSEVDLSELVAKMSQSLAELIMLAPDDAWAMLLAEAIRHLGDSILTDNGGTGTAH